MKRILILSISLHFLFALNATGQKTRFSIYPELGMKYIYECTESNFVQNMEGDKSDDLIKTKLINFQYDIFQPESQKYLLVKILKNTVEKPEPYITNYKDYRFPEFRDGFYDTRFPDFYEELFCRINFKYNFEIESGDVNLLNREEVLLDVRKILTEKGFGKDEINKRTTIFNQEAIPQITNYLKSIYQVSAEFHEGQSSFASKYDCKIEVRDSIITFNQKKWDVKPGLYIRNFSIDFNNFDDISEKYKTEMDTDAYKFVTNEITAYFLNRFYDYLDKIHFSDQDKIDIPKLEELLNSYNIHKIYNNYGIHSRLLVREHLNYNFINLSKVKEYRYQNYKVTGVTADFYFKTDISQKVELARAVLTGHPLYCELTEIFLNEIRKENRFLTQDKKYTLNQIDNYFDLMIRVCNDNEFVNAIKEIRKNNLQWQNKNHVPEAKFFNENGEPKYFKDFLGEKPAVFYISYRWDRERYYWDKLAEDNPELNVVMVMSGSNFQEWTKYIEAATPIAKQLFLVNIDLKLTDIFLLTIKME